MDSQTTTRDGPATDVTTSKSLIGDARIEQYFDSAIVSLDYNALVVKWENYVKLTTQFGYGSEVISGIPENFFREIKDAGKFLFFVSNKHLIKNKIRVIMVSLPALIPQAELLFDM